jgi:7,8-dihydroneopterin aldolase/epimerase/oxygenase
VKIELHGVELFGYHGANEDERRDGQTFLFDVEIELPEPGSDELEATVDYRRLRDAVREISDARAYVLLESLAADTAAAIARDFPVERVTVRVRKPGVAWAEWTAATASRSSSSPS